MISDHVDAVVRVYDLAELPCVQSCIFSLLGQMRPASSGVLEKPLQIHLMTQRFTFGETQAVRSAVTDLLRLDERIGLVLHNWDFRDPFDLRVPLLNMALEVTSGRYFACLDSCDLLRPGAFATLLARIDATGAAAALGGTMTQRVRWWGDVFLPLSGDAQRTVGDDPAAIFLLDRLRLPKTLRFQVAQPGAEVPELISRLRKHYVVDEQSVPELLCVRQVYDTKRLNS